MSEPRVRVRPGGVSDAAALRAIRLEALGDSPDAFGDTYDECAKWSEETWSIKASEWNFYLAESDTKVVGMARGETHDERPGSRWLFAMYVSPLARGGQSARALVDAVSAWAAAEGVDALHLYVSSAMHRAKAFYAKVGFVETGAAVTSSLGDGRVFQEMRRDISEITFDVRRVEPGVLYDLRRRVLRGGDLLVDVTNRADGEIATRHYGGFFADRVVVSASLYAVPAPFAPGEPAYQLRYMATDFDVQGRGLGTRLLEGVVAELAHTGVRRIWANARVTAVDFYTGTGWRVIDNSRHISAETQIEHVVIERMVV